MIHNNPLPELINDKLPAYTFPGGYPLIYLDKHNSVLCAECATESLNDPDDSFKPLHCNVYWEGVPIECEKCNIEIESAYGDPAI